MYLRRHSFVAISIHALTHPLIRVDAAPAFHTALDMPLHFSRLALRHLAVEPSH
jgi:hypothetical protein